MSVVEDHSVALGATYPRVHSAPSLARGLRPLEIVGLTDVWSVLVLVWWLKLGARLELGAALFGVALVVLLCPTWRRAERLQLNALDDAAAVIGRASFAFVLLSGLGVVMGAQMSPVLLATAVASVPAVLAGRTLSYRVVRARRAAAPQRTLVVGGGEVAQRLIQGLSRRDDHGLAVIGVLDDEPLLDEDLLGAPVLGQLSHLPRLLDSLDIDAVIVAFGSSDSSTVDAIRYALAAGKRVWAVPRLYEFGGTAATSDHIWGLPVVRLSAPPSLRSQWIFKRAVDLVASLAGLVVAAPLMAVIAVMILRESGRPILLRQERVGLDGRRFNCLKFRSMRVADPRIEATDWTPDEERITNVGRWLRDSSLDELPQLFNVLRGDMSLVGPRPERPYFVQLFGQLYARYDQRHRVPVGLTGLAQIHGLRGDSSIEERVVFDNYYIENWSLLEDMKILMRTVRALRG